MQNSPPCRGVLLYFLFKIEKNVAVEEVNYRDIESVADLFDGGNGGAIIPSADDIIKCGLCDAGDGGEFVDGDVALVAERFYAKLYRFADRHLHHPRF